MARPHKVSLSERVKQRRLSSRAPNPQDAGANALHVAPLPPLPAIEVPAVEAAPEPATAPAPVAVEAPAPVVAEAPAPVVVAAPVPVVVAAPIAQPRAAAPQKPARLELVIDEAPSEVELAVASRPSRPEGPGGARRGIAVVAGFAAVIGIAIGVQISRARSHRSGKVAGPPIAQTAAPVAPVAQTAALIQDLVAPPPPPPPPEPSAEPSAGAQPAASAEAPTATSLRDHALQLLREAKNPEAMAAASQALDADPTDAMPYLVLGSALQDTGRWKEAHRTYELCVKHATKGMLDECRAMLRAK